MLQLLNAMSLPTGIKETVSVLSSDPSNKGGKARFTMVPFKPYCDKSVSNSGYFLKFLRTLIEGQLKLRLQSL